MRWIVASLLLVKCLNAQSPLAGSSVDVGRAIRQFSNEFLYEIELSSTSNFVFSPYSLHSVLTQVMFGSEGNTRTQLQNTLGLSSSPVTVEQYKNLHRNLASGSAQLFTANDIAVAKGFKPKESFRQTLGDGTSIEEYDFENNKQQSVQQINNAVQQKTKGHIRDLLLDQDVNQDTVMLLINAIYFKAQWKTAFNPADTFFTSFNSPVSGLVNTSFMAVDTKVRLVEDTTNNLDILELPYADNTMSMIIVLPRDTTTDISEKLSNFDIPSLRDAPLTDVEVTIPKFNMKYQTYLKKKLTKLGVTEMFTPSANLNGISDLPLYVQDGVHQANIDVNEEGSEAAAATAVIVGVRTISRKKRFFADKPFLFMIYDFQNNIPLFAGKVVDPSNPIVVQQPPVADLLDDSDDVTVNTDNRVAVTSSPSVSSVTSPPQPECDRLLRDFPNALDNHKICEKVKNAGKFLDWLRVNRNLCDQSSDHYNQFMQSSCSSLYCSQFSGNKSQWQRDYSAQCADIDRDNQQDCKNLENKIQALNVLNC